MTYILSGGALNSTHSLTGVCMTVYSAVKKIKLSTRFTCRPVLPDNSSEPLSESNSVCTAWAREKTIICGKIRLGDERPLFVHAVLQAVCSFCCPNNHKASKEASSEEFVWLVVTIYYRRLGACQNCKYIARMQRSTGNGFITRMLKVSNSI